MYHKPLVCGKTNLRTAGFSQPSQRFILRKLSHRLIGLKEIMKESDRSEGKIEKKRLNPTRVFSSFNSSFTIPNT